MVLAHTVDFGLHRAAYTDKLDAPTCHKYLRHLGEVKHRHVLGRKDGNSAVESELRTYLVILVQCLERGVISECTDNGVLVADGLVDNLLNIVKWSGIRCAPDLCDTELVGFVEVHINANTCAVVALREADTR